MTRYRRPETDHEHTLFRARCGCVHVEVRGPRIGWRRRSIEFFSYLPSTRRLGGFDRVRDFRPEDLPALKKCLNEAIAWCKGDAD